MRNNKHNNQKEGVDSWVWGSPRGVDVYGNIFFAILMHKDDGTTGVSLMPATLGNVQREL